MMAAGLIGFLIFALVVLIAYVVVYVIAMVPDAPPPVVQIARLIVGVVALLLILQRAATSFGIAV